MFKKITIPTTLLLDTHQMH